MHVRSEEISQLRTTGEMNQVMLIDVNEELSDSYMLYEKLVGIQYAQLTGIAVNVTDSECIGNFSCYLIMAVTVALKRGW